MSTTPLTGAPRSYQPKPLVSWEVTFVADCGTPTVVYRKEAYMLGAIEHVLDAYEDMRNADEVRITVRRVRP
jgi:hypothetical protein